MKIEVINSRDFRVLRRLLANRVAYIRALFRLGVPYRELTALLSKHLPPDRLRGRKAILLFPVHMDYRKKMRPMTLGIALQAAKADSKLTEVMLGADAFASWEFLRGERSLAVEPRLPRLYRVVDTIFGHVKNYDADVLMWLRSIDSRVFDARQVERAVANVHPRFEVDSVTLRPRASTRKYTQCKAYRLRPIDAHAGKEEHTASVIRLQTTAYLRELIRSTRKGPAPAVMLDSAYQVLLGVWKEMWDATT